MSYDWRFSRPGDAPARAHGELARRRARSSTRPSTLDRERDRSARHSPARCCATRCMTAQGHGRASTGRRCGCGSSACRSTPTPTRPAPRMPRAPDASRGSSVRPSIVPTLDEAVRPAPGQRPAAARPPAVARRARRAARGRAHDRRRRRAPELRPRTPALRPAGHDRGPRPGLLRRCRLRRHGRRAASPTSDGLWRADDLTALVRIMVAATATCCRTGRAAPAHRDRARCAGCCTGSTATARDGSARNIAAHYDLGNEFFALMLDETMAYSCGIFEREDATLHEASTGQVRAHLPQAARSDRGDHLLEIGTGWGGLAIHAAQPLRLPRHHHDDLARAARLAPARRSRPRGLGDRITLLLEDYRDLDGRYDKLVSIEMIEAVGARVTSTPTSAQCSAPAGAGRRHAAAGHHDPGPALRARRCDSVDFIQRFIFPGSFIPSVTRHHRIGARARPT